MTFLSVASFAMLDICQPSALTLTSFLCEICDKDNANFFNQTFTATAPVQKQHTHTHTQTHTHTHTVTHTHTHTQSTHTHTHTDTHTHTHINIIRPKDCRARQSVLVSRSKDVAMCASTLSASTLMAPAETQKFASSETTGNS